MADTAAKESFAITPTLNIPIPHTDLKKFIYLRLKHAYNENWRSTSNTNKLKSLSDSSPNPASKNLSTRKQRVILTRLRIGHIRVTHSSK